MLFDFSSSKLSFKSDILIFKISSKIICQSRNFLSLLLFLSLFSFSMMISSLFSSFSSRLFITPSTILHNLSAFPHPYTYHRKYFRYSFRFCSSFILIIFCAHCLFAFNTFNSVCRSKYFKMTLAGLLGSLKRLSASPFLYTASLYLSLFDFFSIKN